MAGYHAERLLDAVMDALRAELPATLEAVWAEHEGLDLAAGRALTPYRAPREYAWGDDPVLVTRDKNDFPIVALTGGGRTRRQGLGDPVYGQSGGSPYSLLLEAWCVGDSTEEGRRRALRYAEAMERVLHGHRAFPIAPEHAAALGDSPVFAPDIEVSPVTAVRDDPAESGLTGAERVFYLVGVRIPLGYEI